MSGVFIGVGLLNLSTNSAVWAELLRRVYGMIENNPYKGVMLFGFYTYFCPICRRIFVFCNTK